MALWTDLRFVTQADMLTVDPEVNDVATQESITVDGAGNLVQKTIDEKAVWLVGQMQRFGGYLSSGLVSANHLAAVFNVGGPGINRARIQIGQIVALDLFNYIPVVKTWMLYSCLRNFYRAAYARTVNDRYKAKMDQYETDVKEIYWPNIKNSGLPIVYRPLWCPGAVNERNPYPYGPGTWGASNVSTAAQGGTAGGTFDVVITWTASEFYVNYGAPTNGESYPSAIATQVVAANNALKINIASLNPPTSTQNPADIQNVLVTPANATGWNIYVGVSGSGLLFLQNATPIPVATKTFTLPADPISTIPFTSAMAGQYPDAYYTMQDTLQRG